VKYLSLDWIEAVRDQVKGSAEFDALPADTTFGLTQVITDGPEGAVVYHVQVANGEASFGPGPAPLEQVRLQQTYQVTLDIATGKMPAQELFVKGLVTLSGDVTALQGTDPVFLALNKAFEAVRPQVEY
jgi:hypothetical protein